MNKAVFIDRDGVINSDVGLYYIYEVDKFVINDGIIDGLKLLKDDGFKLIIISNQGGIAKEEYSKHDVEMVHEHMNSVFEKHGVILDAIYYCPHHTEKENCLCRKPNSLMVEKGLARFNIDKNDAFFIGDRQTDVDTAKKAGIKAIKIESNENILSYCKKIISKSI